MKKLWIAVTAILICLAFAGCFQQPASTAETTKPLTSQEAKEASEQLVNQARNTLSAAETVYVYAFPKMIEKFGDAALDMDAERYFVEFANLMQKDNSLIPQDEELKKEMQDTGFSFEGPTFNMDSYSAGMSEEVMQIPSKMIEEIKNYDSSKQGENEYMEAAQKAYLSYLS